MNKWNQGSRLVIVFHHTKGCCLEAPNTICDNWKLVSNPAPGVKIFEEIQPGSAKFRSNYVVLHPSASIDDSEVPELASKASNWDSLAGEMRTLQYFRAFFSCAFL
jgi:hypothetical protein